MVARKRLRSERSILVELQALALPNYIEKNKTDMWGQLCAAVYCMSIALAFSGVPGFRIGEMMIGLAGAYLAASAGGKSARIDKEGVDKYQKRLEGKLADLQRKKQIP